MIREFENILVTGDPIDEKAFEQIKNVGKFSDHALMLADHHGGYGCPIGGVMVSKTNISSSTVGYDIACGMKAVKIDVDPEYVKTNISTIMDEIVSKISFGVGRHNNTKVDHQVFDNDKWQMDIFKGMKDTAYTQLGTVGAGNHFSRIDIDENNNIWVNCHFGSRGLGHKTATFFMNQSGTKDNDLNIMEANSGLGQQYIEALSLVGEYAYAGRDWVCDEITRIIGGNIIDSVHLHHNFLWKENHNGIDYWVGRKGSTPAFPGQKGMIASSMTENCVIFEGMDTPLSRKLFYSTIHGAGRVMSRTQAAGKMNYKTRERDDTGQITQDMMDRAVKEAGIELRGGARDESPQVYKRLNDVLRHHEGTIRILHTLTPLGVAMAGKECVDPFKD